MMLELMERIMIRVLMLGSAAATLLLTAVALFPHRIDRTELGNGWQCRGNVFTTSCAKTVG
ncbi:hypothetical protein [Bradyrhizobium betae]|uniref:Uncharacterized protein n=1 Tax=Bradyrhizobium betae TaxID=244734 RepID=A0A5P6P1M2_9BRAD|nr:hypothetical protein [Bradyrhizobium betae]MCS3725306.1 hypothetical protein [Bradyrhizobium betae]QFI71373.1 hypothetical protein F8237_02720 [Bradyrhizobium betae]